MAVFEANNTAYLVMEYEEGEEFKFYVQRENGTDEQSLRSLILNIVDGLDQVHQYGFLHRDIKPVNLIIRNDGSPVLLDFGAARPTDADAGAHTAYVSAGYTPIEQYQEGDGMEVGPWSDIYSLGATLYFAISGRTPVGPTGRLAALVQRSADPLESAQSVGAGRYSEQFLAAIDWALSFRPSDRPRDLSEWRDALSYTLPDDQPVDWQDTGVDSLREKNTQPGYIASQVSAPIGDITRRRSPVARKSKTGRWALATLSMGALVAASSWLYGVYQQREALDTMMGQAQERFAAEDYVDGAVPIYKQVLVADPQNSEAQARLDEIDQIVVDQIDSSIAAGNLVEADQSLIALTSFSSNETLISAAGERVRSALDKRAIEYAFTQTQALSDAGQHQEVLFIIDSLRERAPGDPRIDELESLAQSEIQQAEERQQQQVRLEAQRQAEQERSEAETRSRILEANRRQQQRRQTYNTYLRNAENALSEGDTSTARRWLDDASALQINDQRLSNLESRVVEQENYSREPLSDYEVSYAAGQFTALRLAIESKNQRSINSLTQGSASRQGLFDSLFKRYTRLEVKVTDIKSELDPKRVTANLRIEAMIQPNGDIVYPSPAYRDTELTLNRQRFGWTRIVW